MITGMEFILIALAAVAAGAVNALAGGGTLITFPILVAAGIPPISANITNTVALSPGYLGATMGQAQELHGQRRRLWLTLPAGVVGGIVGAVLLLQTEERVFQELVPYLILMASGLLAVQERLRAWLVRRREQKGTMAANEAWVILPVGLAAVYGGYFGAGVSVMVLAVLGLFLDDNLTRLNALKQAIAFSINVTAAIFFLFSGQVVWAAALMMAVGALAGGVMGGRLASRIKPASQRRVVVIIGVAVALIYLVR